MVKTMPTRGNFETATSDVTSGKTYDTVHIFNLRLIRTDIIKKSLLKYRLRHFRDLDNKVYNLSNCTKIGGYFLVYCNLNYHLEN